MTPPTASTPACPRCGYDQSGEIATWTDTCPLDGRCTECGTRFDWAAVFDPRRADLIGFVEHARGTRELVVWSLRTWLWTLWPAVFWTRVQVQQRIRIDMMLRWLLIVLVPAHVLAAAMGMVATRLRLSTFPGFVPATNQTGLIETLSYLTFPFAVLRPGVGIQWQFSNWPGYIMPAFAFFIGFPLIMMLLPETRRRAKLRPAHIVRAVAFGAAWAVPLTLFRLGRNIFSATMNTAAVPSGSFRNAMNFGPIRLGDVAPEFWGLVLFIWLAAWWYYAVVRGWRLDQGRIVWVLLTAACSLLAVAASRSEDLLRIYLGL